MSADLLTEAFTEPEHMSALTFSHEKVPKFFGIVL
jgi:hypothetical protein